MPDAVNTGVEGAGELARTVPDQELDCGRASGSIRTWRAAWVVQAPPGLATMSAGWTRQVPCSMTIRP
jgi:hypothetical protein